MRLNWDRCQNKRLWDSRWGQRGWDRGSHAPNGVKERRILLEVKHRIGVKMEGEAMEESGGGGADLTVVEVPARVSIEIGGKKQRGEGKGKDLKDEKSGDGAGGRGISVVFPHVLEVVEVLTRFVIERAIAATEGKGKDKALEEANGGGGVSRVVLLPHELVSVEVLTRLPAKSLMRFKSVSKLWRSTISDPSFSRAHLHRAAAAGSRSRLFITYQDDGFLRFFFSALPCNGKSELLHHFNCSNYKYNGATQVINGLACFFAGNRVSICNIFTGEIMDLPSSDLAEDATNFTYYFGFAPSSKEYKLVKLYSIPIFINVGQGILGYYAECEILNIGSDAPSWRRLSRCQCPRIDFRKRTGVSINGVIYFWHRSGHQLLIFNCEDESFQEIDLPPLASSMLWDCSLLEFRGHCAMVSGLAGDQTLQLWVLELEDQGQSLSYGWIHQVIDIPFGFRNSVFGFIGNLPTGEMLLASSQISNSAMTIYSYEHTEGKFETFEVGIFLSSKEASIRNVKVSYCEEDITPLSCSFPFRMKSE